jgi:hypothetical protein
MRIKPGATLLLILLSGIARSGEEPDRLAQGQVLFERHCGACHSLELPQSQRLDRSTWQWVISDMVNKFGATWITTEEQGLILDYLVEAYGPGR